jgi:hypothetical protein
MPYNPIFDLRGKIISASYNQIFQWDTSSLQWYNGQGQPVSVSSSFANSASNAINAQNAYQSIITSFANTSSYAQSSSVAVSSSYALDAGVLVGVPGPYYGQTYINIAGSSGSVIQIGEVGDITLSPTDGQGITLDSAIGTIQNDGVSGVYLFTDVGSEIVLGTNGTINITDVSNQGQHFDGLGNVIFDNNVTASYFVGNGYNITDISWSLNAVTASLAISSSYSSTSSIAISSSYAVSSSYSVSSSISFNTISSSYALNAYTASYITSSNIVGIVASSSYSTIAVTMPYSSSVQNFNSASGLLTGSMYLQIGPPTFLFVYDGTVWRSSSMA